MVKKSKRIQVHDDEILSKINSETMKLWNKYKIDMSLRELSEKTIAGYQNDLESWWIYIYKNQGNQSIVDLTEDDITEFLYFCKERQAIKVEDIFHDRCGKSSRVKSRLCFYV